MTELVTVGRVGLEVGSGVIRSAQRMSVDGDSISLSGLLRGETKSVLLAMRDQLRGLVETGVSPVYPCRFSSDPTLDGFYRVSGVSIDADPGAYLTKGIISYSLDLDRLPGGHSLPVIESILQGGYRANSVSVSNVSHAASVTGSMYLQPEWSIPATAVALESPNAGAGASAYDCFTVRGWPGGDLYTYANRWSVQPGDFYDGGCLIEQLVDSNWMTVVGRQPIVTDPGKLRISNGYMGVTFEDPILSGLLGVQFCGFGRSAGVLDWTPVGGFMQFGSSTSSSSITSPAYFVAASILRNDPEEVRVRITANTGTLTGSFALDLSLRRGSDYVTAVYTVGGSAVSFYQNPTWRLAYGSAVASTVIDPSGSADAGIYQTAASGGIQPWILNINTLSSSDTTNGIIRHTSLAAGARRVYGLGPVFDSGTSNFTGSVLRWFAPFTERQRIVGR